MSKEKDESEITAANAAAIKQYNWLIDNINALINSNRISTDKTAYTICTNVLQDNVNGVLETYKLNGFNKFLALLHKTVPELDHSPMNLAIMYYGIFGDSKVIKFLISQGYTSGYLNNIKNYKGETIIKWLEKIEQNYLTNQEQHLVIYNALTALPKELQDIIMQYYIDLPDYGPSIVVRYKNFFEPNQHKVLLGENNSLELADT
jgi:hypothetical protein